MLSRTPTAKWTLGSRAFWLRQMRQWHWISAAICLIGMLLFAITGITLNHASQIEAKPQVTARTAQRPRRPAATGEGREARRRSGRCRASLRNWVARALGVPIDGRDAEWSRGDLRLAAAAGRRCLAPIDLDTGEARYERTDRGWIAYLNDLHKGRHTGRGVVAVHRRVRGRLRRVLRHRARAAAAARGPAAFDLAAGRRSGW